MEQTPQKATVNFGRRRLCCGGDFFDDFGSNRSVRSFGRQRKSGTAARPPEPPPDTVTRRISEHTSRDLMLNMRLSPLLVPIHFNLPAAVRISRRASVVADLE